MRTPTSLALVGSILLLGLGSRARAEDPPAEDPATLLRFARVAETVDHDLPKAMELYRKVFASAGDSDAARDAALHLMDLTEARGDRPGALELARALADRFGARLDESMKRQVHEAMARTLPAGSHAKSPLGDVYVLPAPGSASNPSPSPLQAKILAILSRLDTAEAASRTATENDVMRALLPVGVDALPILEGVLYDARPERARFAAQTLARVGKAAAIGTLVKAVCSGDGFTRASAIGGLELIEPSPEVSPVFVKAVEPLLALPTLSDRLPALADALARHLSAKECLDAFERGGPAASTWLYAAGGKDPIETAERIVKTASSDPAVAGSIAEAARRIGGVEWDNATMRWLPNVASLTGPTRQALLATMVRLTATEQSVTAAADIAGAIAVTGSPEAHDTAATAAWGLALDTEKPAVRTAGAETLVARAVSPTHALFEKPSRAAAFAEVLTALASGEAFRRDASGTIRTLFRPELFDVPALWSAVEHLASAAPTSNFMANALNTVGNVLGGSLPPPAEDARWLGVVARSPRFGVSWIRRAAGRLGDPKLLDIVRSDALGATEVDSNRVGVWFQDLAATYRGPGRGAFVLDVYERWGNQGWRALAWIGEDPEFWPLFAKRLAAASDQQRSRLLMFLTTGRDQPVPPPAALDGTWLAELRRAAPPDLPIVEPIVAAAARSGSPEYVAILRELIAGADKQMSVYLRPMVRHLKEYAGPDRLAVLVELLSDPKHDGLLTKYVSEEVWDTLAAEPDRAAVGAALDRIAHDPTAPGNDRAVSSFFVPEKRDELIAIFHAMEKPETAMREPYRAALVRLATRLHLKEAIPFLLKEYREGRPAAAAALDEIRTFYDRIQAFEGAADGRDPLAAELDAVTKGATVELRRASVFALAATHGVKAVPALLEIARTTADEPVRTAAIEMIEKLARGAAVEPVPAPKAPAPPAGTPAPAVDPGK